MNFKPKLVRKGDSDSKVGTNSNYEPVTKYMTTDLITFTPETDIIKAIDSMIEHQISGAPVLNENKELVGMISEKDCITVIIDSVYHNQPISTSKVSKYMTTNIKTVSIEADVVDVANEFLKKNYKRFPVIDEKGRLIGQISRRDILRAVKAMDITTWQNEIKVSRS
jgi:CBS domain-containing protein